MKKFNATKPSSIHINKVKNLYLNGSEPVATNNIYIDEVENLYMGNIELAATATSYDASATSPHQPSISTLTNSQFVLACYYILLSWGVLLRVNVDTSDVARFMHSLTGRPYKGVDSSDFYKKLLQVPHLKSNRELIKDLEVVQNLLLHLELKDAYLLVEKEITIIRREINKPRK